MPWVTAYNPLLTEALIDQLLGIIYRDMQAALDLVSGAPGSLATFAEWDLDTVPIQQFPALLLTPDSEAFDIDSPMFVSQIPVRITGAVAVTHQVPNQLARLLQRYLRAVYIVVRTAFDATPNDFYSPLALPPGVGQENSLGLALGSLKQLWIEGLAYQQLRQHRTSGFAKAAVFSITAELRES
jgi:hypothetical protein